MEKKYSEPVKNGPAPNSSSYVSYRSGTVPTMFYYWYRKLFGISLKLIDKKIGKRFFTLILVAITSYFFLYFTKFSFHFTIIYFNESKHVSYRYQYFEKFYKIRVPTFRHGTRGTFSRF